MKSREPILNGEVAHIPLSGGMVAIIDARDVAFVAGATWSVLQSNRTAYARRTIKLGDKQKTVLLHRVVIGAEPEQHVDHINGNGLDCRRSNLRIVTQQQNNFNMRGHHDSRTGIKGVRKHSSCNKFQAAISAGGVRRYLGLFNTAEEAQSAYAAASAELHGQFGRTT